MRNIYAVTGQLNGLYLPDTVAYFTSYRDAKLYLRELTQDFDYCDNATCYTEHFPDDKISYLYMGSTDPDGNNFHCTYYYAIEPIPWRELATNLNTTTYIDTITKGNEQW